MDRPWLSSSYMGERAGDPGDRKYREGKSSRRIRRWISRKATSIDRSSQETRDIQEGGQKRFNRVDVHMQCAECRASSYSGCSRVRTGSPQAATAAGGVLG
jgi:ribosomal protein L44E